MLIEIEELIARYGSKEVTGIIHVGAHLAEEANRYDRFGVSVWWVEANPAVLRRVGEILSYFPNQRLIHALVTDKDDEPTEFNVTNYDGMSSSIFPFGEHTKHSPDTVYESKLIIESSKLDSLVEEFEIVDVNLLNLDIQGAELLALKGATKLLGGLDYIYTEVSTGPTYLGGAQMYQLDQFLESYCFQRVETNLGMHEGTHGDAFYRRVK